MKYYIDTEFIEGFHKPLFGKRRHFIDLISIGIVAEDGREYYAISNEFDIKDVWNKYDLKQDFSKPQGLGDTKVYWLRENVLRPIHDELKEKRLLDAEYVGKHYWTASDGSFNLPTLTNLIKHFGKSNKQIAEEIRNFVYGENIKDGGQVVLGKFFPNEYPNPEFYGYYADYDWVLFCSLFGRMIDLPKGFPMYCRDLKQMYDDKTNQLTKEDGKVHVCYPYEAEGEEVGICATWVSIEEMPKYPQQEQEHNALADARFNKKLHEFLNTL